MGVKFSTEKRNQFFEKWVRRPSGSPKAKFFQAFVMTEVVIWASYDLFFNGGARVLGFAGTLTGAITLSVVALITLAVAKSLNTTRTMDKMSIGKAIRKLDNLRVVSKK